MDHIIHGEVEEIDKERHQESSFNDDDNDAAAAIIFSAPLAKKLSQDRLPPTYIGVRRVRPSCREVEYALKQQPSSSSSSSINKKNAPKLSASSALLSSQVVYKVVENGIERRMTSKEKKEHKRKLKQQQQKQKQQTTLQETKVKRERSDSDELLFIGDDDDDQNQDVVENQSTFPSLGTNNIVPTNAVPATPAAVAAVASNTYVQLQLNATCLEEELADFRGDRNGVPPVALPASMARLALQEGLLPHNKLYNNNNHHHHHETKKLMVAAVSTTRSEPSTTVRFDSKLSEEWAQRLLESMKTAEEVRQNENMRPMPYRVIPEAWVRLRPKTLIISGGGGGGEPMAANNETPSPPTTTASRIADNDEPSNVKTDDVALVVHDSGTPLLDEEAQPPTKMENSWSFVSIRPNLNPYDQDQRHVVELLYSHTPFYFSCGAKFGCDFLLYDGPREERHAFAGLRILSCSLPLQSSDDHPTGISWPIPTAYDMAGFVRCLNTAGKLALLATVVRRTTPCDENDSDAERHVAIVDLALEKVLTAPTHQRRARKNPRREAGQNLAKR